MVEEYTCITTSRYTRDPKSKHPLLLRLFLHHAHYCHHPRNDTSGRPPFTSIRVLSKPWSHFLLATCLRYHRERSMRAPARRKNTWHYAEEAMGNDPIRRHELHSHKETSTQPQPETSPRASTGPSRYHRGAETRASEPTKHRRKTASVILELLRGRLRLATQNTESSSHPCGSSGQGPFQ